VGAVAAIPVADTIKRVAHEQDQIVETVDRRSLWRAQTPQGFPRPMLEAAYARRRGQHDLTDDAQLVERAGFPVHIVPDRPTNMKITSRDDFLLAEALASR
jgi:2-C-methyl-D-erythritol 4-phosphate cytidylyltransferase